jgi:hypothetical protein
MDIRITILKQVGNVTGDGTGKLWTPIADPVVLPLTVAMSYGPPLIEKALAEGHRITIEPVT